MAFNYGDIPKEAFDKMRPELIEALRDKLPRHEEPAVQAFKVNVSPENVDAQQEHLGKELHMVDADGLWGIKIGNQGLSLSTKEYVSFDDMMSYLESFLSTVQPILKISHFSQVSLRNINLFKEIEGEPNKFEDIEERKYWGRHSIDSLSEDFNCAGAATRHVYYSRDFLSQIQLASGVVLPQQSYIPQEEWNIWKLRGAVPALSSVQLMIDISGIAYQAPINQPDKQKNLTQYSWEVVSQEFHDLHDLVNRVYTDLTKD